MKRGFSCCIILWFAMDCALYLRVGGRTLTFLLCSRKTVGERVKGCRDYFLLRLGMGSYKF